MEVAETFPELQPSGAFGRARYSIRSLPQHGDTSSPRGSQPLPRDPAPRTDASKGARSVCLLHADPASGLAQRLLTALSAPRQREGAQGRWLPGLSAARIPPLNCRSLQPIPGGKVQDRLSARLPDFGLNLRRAGRGGAAVQGAGPGPGGGRGRRSRPTPRWYLRSASGRADSRGVTCGRVCGHTEDNGHPFLPPQRHI